MGSLVYRCRSLAGPGWLLVEGARAAAAVRWKGSSPAELRNKPLKQWTLIVNPLSGLRAQLPCHVRVRTQDPLTYPDADRVFVTVSGVDRNVHRGLDLDNIEVKYDEDSRQVLINSRDIDSQTCVDVTTPVRFDVDIKTSGTGSINVKKIECDNCLLETERGDSILQSIKGHNVHVRTKGGKVAFQGAVHGNVEIHASDHSTVDIEKLLGSSIHIYTEDGHLRAKYLYAESTLMSSTAGDIVLGSIHGDTRLHTEQGNITVDIHNTSPHFNLDHQFFVFSVLYIRTPDTEGCYITSQTTLGGVFTPNTPLNSRAWVPRGSRTYIEYLEKSKELEKSVRTLWETYAFSLEPGVISGSRKCCITVKLPATLQSRLQVSGAKIDVSPEIQLQEMQRTSRDGQEALTATMNSVDEPEKCITVDSKKGTVTLKLQSWLQSLKLPTT